MLKLLSVTSSSKLKIFEKSQLSKVTYFIEFTMSFSASSGFWLILMLQNQVAHLSSHLLDRKFLVYGRMRKTAKTVGRKNCHFVSQQDLTANCIDVSATNSTCNPFRISVNIHHSLLDYLSLWYIFPFFLEEFSLPISAWYSCALENNWHWWSLILVLKIVRWVLTLYGSRIHYNEGKIKTYGVKKE